jgi:hypothetical protein
MMSESMKTRYLLPAIIASMFMALAFGWSPSWCALHPGACTTTSTRTTTSTSTSTLTTLSTSSVTIASTTTIPQSEGRGSEGTGGLPCYTCEYNQEKVLWWNFITETVWVYYPGNMTNVNLGIGLGGSD